MDCVLAVDVGGTKLAAGLVDGQGRLSARVRAATPAGADAEGLWAVLADLVARVRAGAPSGARLVACGVGCGGPMRGAGSVRLPEGALVSPLNIPGWRDFPLQARLTEATGLACVVDNDAKALVLGEGWAGGGVGHRDFMAMVVSTGVGGGIVLDGRLLDGTDGNAGHIGHVIVVPDGRTCECGARGCLEAEASGLHIERFSGRAASQAGPELVARTGRLVGQAVASVANLLDLRLALVAGSVALGFGRPFFAAAQAEVDRSSRLAFSRGTVVRPAGLGDEGPLVGAAALAWLAQGHPVLAGARE